MVWIALVVSTALVVAAGRALTRAADGLADATGLGRVFIGRLLLAGVTSLPELCTSLVACLMYAQGALVVGNVLGSNVVNLAFVPILEIMTAGGLLAASVSVATTSGLATTALTSIALLAIVVVAPPVAAAPLPFALLIVAFYVTTQVLEFGAAGQAEATEGLRLPPRPLVRTIALSALVIVGASFVLTWSCEEIARRTGLGRTFVGCLVLALVTSLPELTVSIEAIRLGRPGMALANIVGSNEFNIAILGVCALVAPWASPLATPEPQAAQVLGLCGIAMISLLALGAPTRMARPLVGRLSVIGLAMAVGYVVANVAAFRLGQ